MTTKRTLIVLDVKHHADVDLESEVTSWMDSLTAVTGFTLYGEDARESALVEEVLRLEDEENGPHLHLERGTVVRALKDLDPEGADVKAGELGIVFEKQNFYGDHNGPMVRWFSGGMCNVYPGWVEAVTRERVIGRC